MDKQKLFTLLYVVLIVALICFMAFMVYWLQTESKSCMQNPVEWFEEKNPDAVCSCYKQGEMFAINGVQMHINTEMIINPDG